ncbi:hypothetical protein KCU78_g6243, partial [Aureobasidium melanogenum]
MRPINARTKFSTAHLASLEVRTGEKRQRLDETPATFDISAGPDGDDDDFELARYQDRLDDFRQVEVEEPREDDQLVLLPSQYPPAYFQPRGRYDNEPTAPAQDDDKAALMPPPALPPRRIPLNPFGDDTSEALPRNKAPSKPIPDFEVALGLYCELAGTSRKQYTILRHILQMTDSPKAAALPETLDTLKLHVSSSLPLIELRRKKIDLVPEKQPTQAAGKKGRPFTPAEWLHFLDPYALI